MVRYPIQFCREVERKRSTLSWTPLPAHLRARRTAGHPTTQTSVAHIGFATDQVIHLSLSSIVFAAPFLGEARTR